MAITDSFNRSDANPIDGNWATMTGLGAIRLVSNAIRTGSGGNTDSAARRTDGTFPDDQYAQVVLSADTSPDAGPAVRCSSSAETMYFGIGNDAGNTKIWRVVAGAFTQLASVGAPAWALNDVFRIEVAGTGALTVVRTLRNGSQIALFADVAGGINSGNPGVFMFEGAVIFDDFECTDFTPSGSATYSGCDGTGCF